MSLTPSEPSSGEGQAGVAVEAIDHQLLAPSITEATTITGNLTSFLIEDIEEKGCHLLLPYLTTNDLLRLSECCQATTNYRYYLKSVKLVPHKSPLLSMFKRGLNQLFFHQRYTTLDYLAVDSLLSLPYFRALVLLGCIQGIKVLDVSGGSIHFGDKEMADLASTLMDGAGQQLQELRIRLIRNEANDAAVQRFILGLSLGMCPRLQRLYLQHPYHNDPPEGFLEGESIMNHCIEGAKGCF